MFEFCRNSELSYFMIFTEYDSKRRPKYIHTTTEVDSQDVTTIEDIYIYIYYMYICKYLV